MPSSSDTGHAKNLANFKDLVTACTFLGAAYNPVNLALKLPALNTLAANAQSALNDINNALPVYNQRVGEREQVFNALGPLVTRAVNAHAVMSTNSTLKISIKGLVRKLRGGRTSTPPAPTDGTPPPATSSASQTSFDNKLDHFDKIVKALQSDPGYLPNETDLTIASLQTALAGLQAKNSAVVNAYYALDNARMARNTLFYVGSTGLVPVALQVKQYVKSLYGASSPQFKQVSAIAFRTVKS